MKTILIITDGIGYSKQKNIMLFLMRKNQIMRNSLKKFLLG